MFCYVGVLSCLFFFFSQNAAERDFTSGFLFVRKAYGTLRNETKRNGTLRNENIVKMLNGANKH